METEAGGARLGPRLAVDQVEALAAVSLVEQSGGVAILQQWIGGRREAVSVFRAGGRVVARFAQVAYRMVPPLGGSSVVRESIPLPADLTTAADALATASGLEGYAEIEFRRDLEGRPYLMEINPRLSASVEIAVRCGVDFPRLLYTWAIGGELADQANPRVGVRMRWLGGDVRWLSETLRSPNRPDVERRSRALSTFATDFIRPAHYDYVALNDPKPAVLATASFIKWHARAAVRTAPKAT
jgi:predicted ATP-grasp superfamily ATP-dependent carboligase